MTPAPRSLSSVGTALVPTRLSQRITEGHPDALRAFLLARHQFIQGQRIDMGELAGELGVERTSLFRWVGNRDALLSEVLWSLTAPTFDRSEEAAASQHGAERICTVLSAFVSDLIVADFFRIFLRREPARALRLLTTTASEVQRRFLAVVETLIREEVEDEAFETALPEHDLAYLLVRIAESFTYADLINAETPSAERARAAFEFVLRPQPHTESSESMTIDDNPPAPAHADALTGLGLGSMSVAAILAETAHRTPNQNAVSWAGGTITYGELWQQTQSYAGALRALGIGPGDRVAMLVPNVPDFPRVYYAVLALGAIVVPIHLLFKSEEIEFVVHDSGAKVLVAAAPVLGEGAKAAQASGIPVVSVLVPDAMAGLAAPGQVPVPRLEDLAAAATPIERYESTNPLAAATILYTSGTTGRPKGAVGSHLAIIEQVNVALIDSADLTRDDVVFGGLPLFHTFGQTSVMNIAFRRGCCVLFLPKFDGSEAIDLMVKFQATVFTAVPTMFIALLQAAATNPGRPPLRYAISGGAALPLKVLEAFHETFGAEVHEGYGLTETSPTITVNFVGEPIHPGTVGRPLWGVDAEIADAELEGEIRLLPRGELGEVVARGHNLFKGYLGNPAATAAAFVDGWFRTGDLGTKDDDDIITIVDRKKDMIVRNGYNIYPSEIEDVIMRHPAVAQVAVFGLPHDTHGQEVNAAVVLAAGASASEADIISYTEQHVAAYKFPRHIHFVDALPLGASGKVLKRQLVADYS